MTASLNSNYEHLTDWAAFGIAVGYVLCDPKLSDAEKLAGIFEIGRVVGRFSDCACGGYKGANIPVCARCDQ